MEPLREVPLLSVRKIRNADTMPDRPRRRKALQEGRLPVLATIPPKMLQAGKAPLILEATSHAQCEEGTALDR
jgi:hypothetical protein